MWRATSLYMVVATKILIPIAFDSPSCIHGTYVHVKSAHDDPPLNRTRGIAERVPMRRNIKQVFWFTFRVDFLMKTGIFSVESSKRLRKGSLYSKLI